MTDSGHGEGGAAPPAEFDAHADSYYRQHKANTASFGEEPEYFSDYKIAGLRALADARGAPSTTVFDFGSGIGNSIVPFRRYFGSSQLTCGDVSRRSHELARQRFPGREQYILIDDAIPLPAASQDIVFSACVFHHIPHDRHADWLGELLRITKPGGLLAIYEHNPYNPLTVRAVNTCPFDANAALVRPRALQDAAISAGWSRPSIGYTLFFPRLLARLRPLEPYLSRLPVGAQYRLVAWRS